MKHKSLRALCALLAVLLLVMAFAACKQVKPITAAQFMELTQAEGYVIEDFTAVYAESGWNVVAGLEATKGDIEIAFFSFDTSQSAVTFFGVNKEMIEAIKQSGELTTTVTAGARNVYKLRGTQTYYILNQAGPTLLYASCPRASAAALDAMIEALGY